MRIKQILLRDKTYFSALEEKNMVLFYQFYNTQSLN